MDKQYNRNARKICFVSTVILILLLLLFFIVTFLSTRKLNSQIQLISEHPFIVNGDISDVKTKLALMRVRTERLQAYNHPDDVEAVRVALDELYQDVNPLINEIDSLYLGPDEDVSSLKETFSEIKKAHTLLLNFAKKETSSVDEISVYEKKYLYPLYDQFEQDAQRILLFVRGTQQNVFSSADKLSRNSLVWSLLIVTAMIVGLYLFQYYIGKLTQQLLDKTQQFDMLSETIDEIFLIFNQDSEQCDFVSESTEKVLGLPADKLKKDWKLLFQNMDHQTAASLTNALNNNEHSSWEETIEYHFPERVDSLWFLVRIYKVKDSAKKYIMTLTDRTGERLSRQALEDALKNAQNANNAKRDFLSRMSHEIRTPMNAIIGMTTIAAASIQDTVRVEDCLEKIGYSSKHLLMLINDVLDMSRIESNRMTLTNEPFDLYQFINTFVSVIYPQAQSKGLHFAEKITGFSENTTYIGDSLRLNQIMLNLASNALKFTPQGGSIQLEVLYMTSKGKKDWLRFVVSDTGIGMDESAIERLYTPFEQADATISQKYGGTGLGMSITQNLVTLMGGFIDVKSKPGQGTTFTVELPFERSNIELQPVSKDVLQSLYVLIVDDEKDICEHTALLLEKMKICADWVLNGAEAVKRVVAAQKAKKEFDVCLIDWQMPGMDGVETTRRIREKVGRDTPIIIISAYDWSDIEEEARKAGVDAFIAKPLFQSSIYNVLVNVTNGAFGMPKNSTINNGHPLEGRRILIAEDNALNLEITEELLKMNGADVEKAVNGQEAVDKFIKTPPRYFDAILMDVQMPVMNGCEATKHIRSCGRVDGQTIPIIAATANAFTEDVSTVLAAGMNAHISKPIDVVHLCSVLSQFMGNP